MESKEIIGQIIADARKKKGITQQELAKLLYVSDKAISNWETGKNYPDISSLHNISKYLDINLVALLTKKNKYSKLKKIFLITSLIIFLVIFILLLLFFISNFSKTKYYSISFNNDNYTLENSNLMISNNKVVLNLGTIKKDNSNITADIALYYLDNNEAIHIVTEYAYDNLTINCNYHNNIYFEKEMFKNLDNFYLAITYYDDLNDKNVTDNIKLKFKEIINTNKLFYLRDNSILDINSRTITLLENVGYERSGNETYSKVYTKDNYKIKLKYDLKNLLYEYISNENKLIKYFVYNIKTDTLELNIKYDNVLVESFVYKEDLVCLLGTCDNFQELIDEFFQEYNLIK